jgi:hypothetical protein
VLKAKSHLSPFSGKEGNLKARGMAVEVRSDDLEVRIWFEAFN